jgi:hypothetical protein
MYTDYSMNMQNRRKKRISAVQSQIGISKCPRWGGSNYFEIKIEFKDFESR